MKVLTKKELQAYLEKQVKTAYKKGKRDVEWFYKKGINQIKKLVNINLDKALVPITKSSVSIKYDYEGVSDGIFPDDFKIKYKE